MTGASNFDICEFIILQMLAYLCGKTGTLAMLCKTQVARNLYELICKDMEGIAGCEILEFDARKIFHISAAACLFVVRFSPEASTVPDLLIKDLASGKRIGAITYENGHLLDRNAAVLDLEGSCPFEWRQGIKHDAGRVMELDVSPEGLTNRQKELVDIEPDLVYILIKSSMIKSAVISDSRKRVIVTQKKARASTEYIQKVYPKTYSYLEKHRELFDRRKSSIYKGAPPFSMFGVGDYSFAQWKVGISGFYKEPLFALLHSGSGKAIQMDDTCYFLSFDNPIIAQTVMLLLNSQPVQSFLKSIAFLDSKRP